MTFFAAFLAAAPLNRLFGLLDVSAASTHAIVSLLVVLQLAAPAATLVLVGLPAVNALLSFTLLATGKLHDERNLTRLLLRVLQRLKDAGHQRDVGVCSCIAG